MNNLSHAKESGTSMIEVIVTIIVISIGILGLGGLQITSMKYQKTAGQRAEATQSAYDLSERMRANGTGVSLDRYVYTTAYATTVANLPSIPACSTSICTALEVAEIDKAEWLRNLATRLSGGAGYVINNGIGGYDLVVMWKEPNYTGVDPACPSIIAPAPGEAVRCFVVRFTP
jgi:type IV pilus assembly protein PilV